MKTNSIGRPALALVALLSVGLTGCFKPSRDALALRDSVAKAADASWESEVEFGVGTLTFALVRGGAALFEAPPEARAALSSVRGAEVGVYHLTPRGSGISRAGVLAAADRTMKARGWDRLVGVVDRNGTVGVYLPQDLEPGDQVRAMIVVVEEREMVIAGVRGRPEPLLAAVASGNGAIQIPGLDRRRGSRSPDDP
jgi:hypothetical protein